MGKKHLFYYSAHSQFTEPTDKPAVSYCAQEDEVHYHPDPFNGHKYIDLGLPSGTLWAKMNVGASTETDTGLYFAWGETQGYAASQVGTNKQFSWSNYRWTNDNGSTMSKYNATDKLTNLELTDDAAAVNWGGDWHMPTRGRCLELFQNTKNGFVTSSGTFTQYVWDVHENYAIPTQITAIISGWNTAGYFFFKNTYTSVTDAISAKDYLFIPAAGNCVGGEVFGVGTRGGVWTSALGSEDVKYAWLFIFNSNVAGVGNDNRYFGQSVRAVINPVKLTYNIVINSNDLYLDWNESTLQNNGVSTIDWTVGQTVGYAFIEEENKNVDIKVLAISSNYIDIGNKSDGNIEFKINRGSDQSLKNYWPDSQGVLYLFK